MVEKVAFLSKAENTIEKEKAISLAGNVEKKINKYFKKRVKVEFKDVWDLYDNGTNYYMFNVDVEELLPITTITVFPLTEVALNKVVLKTLVKYKIITQKEVDKIYNGV